MTNTKLKSSFARCVSMFAAAAMVVAPGMAGALEMQAQFDAGIGYSDNIARTTTNATSETIRTVGLDFNLVEESRKLDASIRSTFDYMDYVDGTFDSEVIGGLVAVVDYAFVEERLFWLFQYNWGQQLLDLFDAANPGNRENVSTLLTGPRLVLPLGARNALITDLQYTNTQYEFRPYDFESGAVLLQLGREVRDNGTFSLNGSARRFEFSDDQFPNYDQTEGFFRWDSKSERNVIELDVGYTQVEAEGEKGDGMLLRANWTRTLSALSELQLGAGSQYSDQGDIFRFFQNITENLDETNAVLGFGTPFRNDFATASVNYKTERTVSALTAVVTRERYELIGTNNLDRDYYGFELTFNREMSRKFFVAGGLFYRSVDYTFQNRTDTDTALDVSLGFRFSPAFNIAMQYQYQDRSSTDPASESSENRALLRFGYVPNWGR
jgi:hypothetical protein